MKKLLASLGMVLWAGLAHANCSAIPNVFSTGLIFSAPVNANFSYLGLCSAANGANSDITSLSAVTSITGLATLSGTYLVPIANGGTHATAMTAHGFATGGDGTTMNSTAACAANSVPIGNGASEPTCSTMSALLDAVFGSTRGMILKRGASTWGVLALGSNGQCLASNGTDPLYQSCGTGGLTQPKLTVLTSGSSATFTSTAGATHDIVRMVGGGGGGGGSTGAGGDGGDTTFGALTAGKGKGGGSNATTGAGGAGGTASGCDINLPGSEGSNGSGQNGTFATILGPSGAPGFMGAGAGLGGTPSASGSAAGANTGAGGGGNNNDATHVNGGGGGAGAYCEKLIITPAATYTYTVGAAGAAGTGGANLAGGAGGAGVIMVYEYFD